MKPLYCAWSVVYWARVLMCLGPLLGLCTPVGAQERWVVGQSAPLTGSNAKFGADIRDGARAYFAAVNARGGVAGKTIELVTLDDKNDRALAAANAKVLLENKHLLALFGFASATLSLDALPQAQAKGVAFFAPFSGANPVRTNSPVLFTVRASYGEEMQTILDFWTSLGFKRPTVVHYDDEVGKQNLAVVTNYLRRLNLEPQALALKRNEVVGHAQAMQLRAQQPDFVIYTVLSAPAAQLQKELVAIGRLVPTSSLSFVGADQFISAAGPAAAGVSIAQVVPNPGAALPVVRECASALEAIDIKSPMNSTQLESCIAAKVLVEGLRHTGKSLSARTLVQALRELGNYDTGGYRVNFSPGKQHGSAYVELAMVTRAGKLVSR